MEKKPCATEAELDKQNYLNRRDNPLDLKADEYKDMIGSGNIRVAPFNLG